jgi:hypothetical protein
VASSRAAPRYVDELGDSAVATAARRLGSEKGFSMNLYPEPS